MNDPRLQDPPTLPSPYPQCSSDPTPLWERVLSAVFIAAAFAALFLWFWLHAPR